MSGEHVRFAVMDWASEYQYGPRPLSMIYGETLGISQGMNASTENAGIAVQGVWPSVAAPTFY